MSEGSEFIRDELGDASEERAPGLELTGLAKRYEGQVGTIRAFEGVSLKVAVGEFVSVIGASGCGKSTLLHVISGLEPETGGEIRIHGKQIPAPSRTDYFGYMFQKDLLLPWAKIVDNVTLGLVMGGCKKSVARERALQALRRYGLGAFSDVYPFHLSGGMRQRVALARTLVMEREMLLLDEPFGALDALTRSEMQDWLLMLWEEHRHTVLFVTHDVQEAVFLSDRVVVMSGSPGRMVRDMPIDLPRPRQRRSVLASREFGIYCSDLYDSIVDNSEKGEDPGIGVTQPSGDHRRRMR